MARLLNAMCPASNLPNLLQAPVSMPEAREAILRYNTLWKSLELGQFQIYELEHCLQLCPCIGPVDGSQGRGYLSLPMK